MVTDGRRREPDGRRELVDLEGRREFAASASTYSLIVAAQWSLRSCHAVPDPLPHGRRVRRDILAVVLAQVLAIVLNAGFPTAVSRLYFPDHDDVAARTLVSRAILVVVFLGAVCAAVLVWSPGLVVAVGQVGASSPRSERSCWPCLRWTRP